MCNTSYLYVLFILYMYIPVCPFLIISCYDISIFMTSIKLHLCVLYNIEKDTPDFFVRVAF